MIQKCLIQREMDKKTATDGGFRRLRRHFLYVFNHNRVEKI